jgi:hypothetical protein
MTDKSTQDALAGLDRLIAQVRERLSINPDYIALKAFEKARAEMVGIKGAIPSAARMLSMPTIVPDEEIRPYPPQKKVSQLEGAARALEATGHPLPVDTLMDKAVAEGAVVAGEKPVISFGSSLSKSPKFQSVRWNGAYAWWFSDRPMPVPIKRVRLRQAREAAE